MVDATHAEYNFYLVRRINKAMNDKSYAGYREWFLTKLNGLKDFRKFYTATCEADSYHEGAGEFRHIYVMKIALTVKVFDNVRLKVAESTLRTACEDAKWNKYPWELWPETPGTELDLETVVGAVKPPESDNGDGSYVLWDKLNIEPRNHFDGLFGVAPQIEAVLASIRAAVNSGFQHRFHTVLHGEPGCGKTETLLRVCQMVSDMGEGNFSGEGVSYVKLDAVSTTQAGAENFFLGAPIIPAIVVIEEIEKVNEQAMRWLLGVLDRRGEIRKNNARVGLVSRRVHSLVLCTVNDKKAFDNALSGALSSRFPNAIHYPRPGRDIMQAILMREIKASGGDPRWINPTLDYCQQHGINDPRKAMMICMCGANDLLTKKYQRILDATKDPLLEQEKLNKATNKVDQLNMVMERLNKRAEGVKLGAGDE